MESFYSINFTDYYYWPCEFLYGSYVIQLKLARAQFCSSIIFPNFWPCAGHYTLYLHAPPSQLSVLLPFFLFESPDWRQVQVCSEALLH